MKMPTYHTPHQSVTRGVFIPMGLITFQSSRLRPASLEVLGAHLQSCCISESRSQKARQCVSPCAAMPCVQPDGHRHCMKHALCAKEFWPFHSKVCSPCRKNVSLLLKSAINKEESEYCLLCHNWNNYYISSWHPGT